MLSNRIINFAAWFVRRGGVAVTTQRGPLPHFRPLQQLRSTRRLIQFCIALVLVLPLPLLAGYAQAVAADVDGAVVLCQVNGELTAVGGNGAPAPGSGDHDCCTHCLAAGAATGIAVLPGDASMMSADYGRAARLTVINFAALHQDTIRSANARAPPLSA